VGIGKASGSESLMTCRKLIQTASKLGVSIWLQDKLGGYPFTGQVVPGMEATRARSAAFAWNVGRRALILLPVVGGERECPETAETARDRVPEQGPPADRPVVVGKRL